MIRSLTILLYLLLTTTFCTAQYADLGTGKLKNQIWWFDWNGFTLTNGASKTFDISNGLTVTLTFSNISGPTLVPSVMNTWPGAVLHFLYDFSNPSVRPALYNARSETVASNFTVSVLAKRNGITVPVTLVMADAEASDLTEVTTLNTNGNNWKTIEFFRNSQQPFNPVSGCNTKTVGLTDTYGNAPGVGQNPVLSTTSPATGPLFIDVTLDHSRQPGLMGLAFGILEGADRGDLPASYGYAQHQIAYSIENACNYLPPLPVVKPVQHLKMGDLAGDADGIQVTDDNGLGADEDALSSLPRYTGNGTYQLSLPVTNTTGATAFVGAWFDFNGNGVFDLQELATATIAPNTSRADITWNGVPAQIKVNAKYAFRFRITSELTVAQSANIMAIDGEVEDYYVVLNSQTVSANFITPDTVCVNTPVHITNTSTGASSYYWNFCTANVNQPPVGVNFGNIDSKFSGPVYIDYVFENGNYYAFQTNNWSRNLVRLDFGNSLLNTPAVTNLGTVGGVIPNNTEGVQVIKNEGKWYVIVVGGDPAAGFQSAIVKIELGSNIANNAPTGVNWGNIGNLSYPHDLYVFDDGGRWYGLTVNTGNNTITRFDFSSSFSNTPAAVNLGNIGFLGSPTGVHAFKDDGRWYAFVTNASGNSISRLDFGTSLLNTPTGVNLGNIGNSFRTPWDIYVMKYCEQRIAFLINAQSSDLVKLDFGSGITSVPTAISYGNIGNLNFPHCLSKIFRVGADLYTLIPNVNNSSLTRLKFSGCTNVDVPSTSLQNPPPVTYNAPGVYNINLSVDDSLPTQAAYCRQVVVVASVSRPLQKKTICAGDSVLLNASSTAGNTWSNGSNAPFIYAKKAGLYWVRTTNGGGCISVDTFSVAVTSLPIVKLGIDTAICDGESFLLNAGNAGADFLWQNGQTAQTISVNTAGLYHVAVTKDGCTAKDSISIASLALPAVAINGKNSICREGKTELIASGGHHYSWLPIKGLSNPSAAVITASPQTTTKYTLTVTGQNGCKAKDSITVTVTPKPVFTAIASKPVLCFGDTALLTASGGDSYRWSPAISLNNPNGQSTKAFPLTSTQYKVVITDVKCQLTDSLFVNLPVADKPLVKATKTNDINCFIGQAQIIAGGGSRYRWQPATGLSDPTSSRPVVQAHATTTYHVSVTTAEGCVVEDSITVNVVKGNDGTGFPVPSAFTPNNDGKNDCFGVRYWGDVKEFSMNVYNRWGEVVFHANNASQCWNGMYKGQLQPSDSYVYLIKAKTLCGDLVRKGTFTLLK